MTLVAWIPLLPLIAAGIIALMPRSQRLASSALAVGSMLIAFVLSCLALLSALKSGGHGLVGRDYWNFDWIRMGGTVLQLGLLLDPLTAVMLVMITFVGSLIFIFSVGYMHEDGNYTRFFGFLSLFAAAMLGLVVSNSLLMLFMCWELVGLASYLLIGFWYQKPSAAAAAKKAFITTRIGDVGFFLGLLWLYSRTGTLLCYDGGKGCMEAGALELLVTQTTLGGMTLSTAIGLLLFCGAVGKSGQVPLHVWLPDAMEGPTPVSALIHAATMVAAGVFLIARVHPMLAFVPGGGVSNSTPVLQVIAWVGAVTALFAAVIAVAQSDIKRILAYSTVSQLGFMFLGVATGGVAVGMFHLITHAFFKALLFLGSASIIHGCHHEQDIRKMGGLRVHMPVTFVTYAIGMMALSGVPVLFSGFWSKDEILHSALAWPVSRVPFMLAVVSAILTAFYMTRQMFHVFAGEYRGGHSGIGHDADHDRGVHEFHPPHESPRVMTVPLILLAVGAVLLGVLGTPAWPWFETFLEGHELKFDFGALLHGATLGLMVLSVVLVALGMGLGYRLYRNVGREVLEPDSDALQKLIPRGFGWLQARLYVDEFYEKTVIASNRATAEMAAWMDVWVIGAAVKLVTWLMMGGAWASRLVDDYFVNFGFEKVCQGLRWTGVQTGGMQNGDVQRYLKAFGLALVAFLLLLAWGGGRS